MKKLLKVLLLFAAIVIGIVICAWLENNWIQVSRYTVSSTKVPTGFNGFKILQLTDLHSKSFGQDNQGLISAINRIDPDIIVITGDMLNSLNDEGEVFLSLARELVSKYPIYYISGNHEQIAEVKAAESNSGWYTRYIAQLKQLGIVNLDNQRIQVRRGADSINLYGLVLPLRYYSSKNAPHYAGEKRFSSEYIERCLGKVDNRGYNVLLVHTPFYFDTYSHWGADLVLAGHLHGGVIRIPFLGGVLSPDEGLFPAYDAGKYKNNMATMVVSRGLGDSVGWRIFNRPEVVVITLERQSAKATSGS